jgi:tRNA pseudouridine38-40 synthase
LSDYLRFALKFAYYGGGFFGYARQPNLKTVEGEIIKTLIENNLIYDTKKSFFRSASRTDKDVSSLGNVISFDSNSNKDQVFSILKNLSDDIIFYGIKKVKDDFNPRYAKKRHYRYHLKTYTLDLEKTISALSIFPGEHNFSNFARVEDSKNPVRTIDNIIYEIKDNYLIVDFFAPNFLWNQIRRIISAIEKVGMGKVTKEELEEALLNPDKSVDFNVTSAKSLILKDIFYDFDFEYRTQKNKLKRLEKRFYLICNL